MTITNLILIICSLIFIFLLMCFAIYLEKKGFNNGICPKCGKKLEHFDNDSQGGRLYKCSGAYCHYYTAVSWPGVDKKFKEK